MKKEVGLSAKEVKKLVLGNTGEGKCTSLYKPSKCKTKELVLGNIGKCNCDSVKKQAKPKKPYDPFSNPFKNKKKGTWAAPVDENGVPRKKKPSEGNLYVDVSNWF